jgi:hypothetical protein
MKDQMSVYKMVELTAELMALLLVENLAGELEDLKVD